ncbi:MAG: MFS transporter [Candidatus Lustribacter sp.]
MVGEEQKPRVDAAVSWGAFVSTYLPALVLALGTGVAVPALPTLAKSFGVSFGVASGVVTLYLLGNLAGTIPSGWLVDRFGRRPVLIAGPLLSAAMAFTVAGAHSFPELLVLRFFNGVAAQMWIVARLAAISINAQPGQRGRLVSWMFGMDSTGRLAGPVLGGFIASEWGTRSPFIVYAVLALVALIPTILFAKDTPRTQRSERKADEAPARKLSLREIVFPRWQYFGVAFFAGLTRGPLQADLLYLYAAFAYHLGPRPIGYLATSASIISLPIGFIAGWVLDRFGRKRTMVPGFGGVSIAMTALALSAFLHLSLAWYVALFLFGVMLQSFTGGSVQTVGADVAPAEARGTFLGIWRFASQGGAALSPIIFAVLSDTVNYGTAFMFTAVSASIVTFLLVRYVPETRVKTAA